MRGWPETAGVPGPRYRVAKTATLAGVCLLMIACGSSSSDEGEALMAFDGGDGIDDSGVVVGADGGTVLEPGTEGGATTSDGGFPSGWLYTTGAKIYVSDGSGGKAWMGRGVNTDDIFFCGYNSTLGTPSPDALLQTIVSTLMASWRPNFVRLSLFMNSYSTVETWSGTYKAQMTSVINAIGSHPNVYVLVTLRSDPSMILEDTSGVDNEATGVPSDRKTTPNAAKFPTGTDATYVGLVDSFAHSPFVIFGLSNEPGGSTTSSAKVTAALNHAVGTIRAEEDRLGAPHHVVSVQGTGWAANVAPYAATPAIVTHDNVVYEVHGYPPSTSSYTYANIPVILGEYGGLTSSNAKAFYADIESKGISNLAWDFEPYTSCQPDLLKVSHNASMITPSTWGSIVQSYLLSHAP